MDKKWIGIIIILIIGLSAMYYIVTTSNTVGNAVTVIDDVTITLPPGYKILGTHTEDTTLLNEGNNNTIYLKCVGNGDICKDTIKKEVKYIKKSADMEVVKTTDNSVVSQNVTSGENVTVMCFEKWDRTIFMKLSKFNNQQELEKDSQFIIDNIKPDYKQNRA